jgi:A/G-specific adenine glycosylase
VDPPALLAWFRAHKRDLPWREEPRDPYRVWVSEVMLQQTRVETVLRYHAPFLARFPHVRALAEAPEDAVMKAWEGLGYYRRARLLQAGARAVVAEHGGVIPRDLPSLLALPGMGPYTAGAVASLAFGIPTPAVDGNVLRVASRMLALEDDIMQPATRRRVEAWVMERQPRDAAGAFNEALMELGATVCAPKSPRCDACPVADGCAARAMGRQERYPIKAPKAEARVVRVAMAIARRGDALLLEKRETGLLAGTWGLPYVEVAAGDDPRAALAREVARITAGTPTISKAEPARARHVFTHRVWEMEGYEVEASGAAGAWRSPDEVSIATAHRRLLDATSRSPAPSSPSRRRRP